MTLNAELCAAMLAIELAHRKGWQNLWLECDSQLVIAVSRGVLEVVGKFVLFFVKICNSFILTFIGKGIIVLIS